MRLLPISRVEVVFAPLAGKKIAYCQGHWGNVGDGLIERATFQLFAHFDIRHVIVNTSPSWDGSMAEKFDEMVLFGGGNMGYPGSGALRGQANRSSLPKTLLPQSWVRCEDAPYRRVFAREPYSLAYCSSAVLAPDLALCLDYSDAIADPELDLGVFLRGDSESKFPGSTSDPVAGLNRWDCDAYIRKAATYASIVTDRLHFAIAGLICRRRVILLPNSYHKNIGVYEAWLKDLGCDWAISPEEAIERCQTLKPLS